MNNRQAFITFGDKSWGSVKMGKDLGIFASDAILSDATLLGVGGGSAAGQNTAAGTGNTSLGRIGFGYIYADWKPQISYTTPNMSGFQATVGIAQGFTSGGSADNAGTPLTQTGTSASPAYEGKASYAFNANGVDGKIWVSGISQHVRAFSNGAVNSDPTAYAADVGIKLASNGFDAVAYYYGGNGLGTEGQGMNAYGAKTGGGVEGRDTNGGYVQLGYTLPTKTRAVASWGASYLDKTSNDQANVLDKNEMWDAMLIHPLTKHLNLVAEYSHQKSTSQNNLENSANVGSLGAILFF
jgi:predicted porin